MKRFSLFLGLLLLSATATARNDCELDLRYDLRASIDSLQVSTPDKPLYEVQQGGVLFVGGGRVPLDETQQALTEQYAGEVAALLSQWIESVSTALEMLEETVQSALGGAFGEDSPATIKAGAALAKVRQSFAHMTAGEEGVYSLTAEDFNDLGDKLEQEVEGAMETAAGALLTEIGKTLTSGEGSFTERMVALGARMRQMGQEMEGLAEFLRDTRSEMCAESKKIRQLEKKLAREIPELADYSLFR